MRNIVLYIEILFIAILFALTRNQIEAFVEDKDHI